MTLLRAVSSRGRLGLHGDGTGRWREPTTDFATVAGYFPGPVCSLRTLKSDTIAGLTPETVAALEATGTSWRTSGVHCLVQVHGGC